MKKKIIVILIIGLFLRIILSLTTYHSDVVPFDFAGRILTETKLSNFYDYLWQLPDDHPYLKVYPRNLFNYPPPAYLFLGAFSRFFVWIIDPMVYSNFLFNLPQAFGNIQFNFLLLFLKLPYFIFDIAIAYFLMKLFDNEKQKMMAFSLWIFNPVNLYATYMLGQFDIIPTFFVVSALVLAFKNEKYLTTSSVLLGIGAAFKIFPLLFILPLAFIKKTFWQKAKIFAIGFFTYAVFAYSYIGSHGFRKTALLAGQTTKSLYANIPISGGESIILFLVAVVFFYLIFYFCKTGIYNLWKRFFVMLLLFFIFTHFHPQWFLWITPFYIIDLITSKFRNWTLVVLSFIAFLVLLTFFDPGLTVGLFSPINPELYYHQGIWQTLGINIDINLMRSIFHSLLVGVSVYYIYLYFPKNRSTDD